MYYRYEATLASLLRESKEVHKDTFFVHAQHLLMHEDGTDTGGVCLVSSVGLA